jgi:hypothetical protein
LDRGISKRKCDKLSVLNKYGVMEREIREKIEPIYETLNTCIKPLLENKSFEDITAIQEYINSEVSCYFAVFKIQKSVEIQKKERGVK